MTSPSEKQLLAASWDFFYFFLVLFCFFPGTDTIVVHAILPLVLLFVCFSSTYIRDMQLQYLYDHLLYIFF